MSQFLRNTLNFSLDDVELEEETQRILSNGKIQLEDWYINKLVGEINKELDYKDLMPSRKWDFFWKGATISLIIIMVVFILNTFESIYWKIGLPLICLVVACIGFLIGLYVKKKKELVTIESLVQYVFQKLSQWTIHKLHNTNDLNEQRILIENYLNCFFTYRSSLRLPIWDEALHIENIKEIINNQKFEKALKLSFKLFDILYQDEKQKQYNKEGVFIIIKIFMSIKYYCDRVAVQKHVEQLEKDFYLQTGINPTEKPIIQILPFPQKVEVVNKDYFKYSVPFFQYFENIWQSGYNDIESGDYVIEDVCNNCQQKFCVCDIDNKTFLYMSQKVKPQLLNSSKQDSYDDREDFIKKHSHKIKSEYQDENSQNRSMRQTLMRLEKIGLEINQSMEEQEELLPAVSKLLSIESEPDSNFKIITDKTNLKIMKKTEEGNPVILVKSYLVVDGSIDDIYTLLTNLELRMQWDSVFSQMKVMKIFNKNCDVVYSYIKAPLFVTDRDFLQKRQLLRNHNNIDFIIAFENYEDTQFPEKKGVIRANSIISGYIIRKKSQTESYLTIISQNDIKGYIPKSIVNAQVAKAPIGWVKKFNKAIKAYKENKL